MTNPEKAFEKWFRENQIPYGIGGSIYRGIERAFLAGRASASEENTSECDKSDYLHVHKRSLCEHGMYVAMCASCMDSLLHTQREEMVAKLEGMKQTRFAFGTYTQVAEARNKALTDAIALLRNQP